MDPNLYEELVKKDEDFRILDENTVFTRLDIGEPIEASPLEPLTLVPPSIPSRIARHIFIISSSLAFFYSIFGLVPFYLLQSKLPFYLILLLCITFFCLNIALGILCFLYRSDPQKSFPLSLIWACLGFCLICSFSVLLNTLAPFEGCVILFIEYTIALLYCLAVDKEEGPNPYWVAALMLLCGSFVWILGIYMQDWISWALLGILCLVVAPLYTAYEVREMNRYSLLEKDLLRAPIEFFTDWATLWCRMRRPPPPLSLPREMEEVE